MQYNGLSYRLYLDFPSFFHYYPFPGPGSNPGSHFVFSFHVLSLLQSETISVFVYYASSVLLSTGQLYVRHPNVFRKQTKIEDQSRAGKSYIKEVPCVASDRKTNPEPSCHIRNLLAPEAKRPRAYAASEWHLYPFLPLGLILLWTVRSFSDMHLPHSYKTAGHMAVSIQCVWILTSVPPSQLCSYWLWFCHLPILEPGGKYKCFLLLLKWGYVAQSCDHHLVTMTGEEDTRTLKMDRNLSSDDVICCRINQPWMWPGYMK